MIGSIHRQSSLFYVALGHQASLIKDDLLEPLDALLDDEALVELVRERLTARNRLSTKAGREGIAPDRLLRCCVLEQPRISAGAADWQSMQAALRELGSLNRDAIIEEARAAKTAARKNRPGTRLPAAPRGVAPG